MMKQLFTVLQVLFLLPVCAQELKTYQVKPGQTVYQAIGPEERYTYPAFESGIVHFRSGRVGSGRLNYNAILAAMEFIDDKGDTLTLSDMQDIRTIVIKGDTFFVDKQYLQKVDRAGKIVLAKLRMIPVTNRRRIGAMGQVSDASVDGYTALSSSGQPLKTLVAQELLTYKEQVVFYFGDRYGNFVLANKKNLAAMTGAHRRDMEKYMAEKNPNFLREADMRQLLSFLASLD